MKRFIVGVLLVGLVGCGTTTPALDYPATVGALETTIGQQQTSIARAQADNVALGERIAVVQRAATAEALRPTPTLAPTPTPLITTAISATTSISLTTTISTTAPLSPSVTLNNDECGPLPPDVIDYEDAAGFIGEAMTVQGRIVKVGRSSKAVFLNFHDPYQGYFSSVIFSNAWKNFAGTFEDVYAGRCVRISGTIKEYQGAPEIVVGSPDQILLLP